VVGGSGCRRWAAAAARWWAAPVADGGRLPRHAGGLRWTAVAARRWAAAGGVVPGGGLAVDGAACRGGRLVVGQPPRGVGACVSADAPPGARPPSGRARRAL